MVLSGIAVGFMLYVIASISRDMGSGGVVPPPLAAWLPAIVATLFGVTVLLHLEDG
jgi:lipopolysaccharide export system permease protein